MPAAKITWQANSNGRFQPKIVHHFNHKKRAEELRKKNRERRLRERQRQNALEAFVKNCAAKFGSHCVKIYGALVNKQQQGSKKKRSR